MAEDNRIEITNAAHLKKVAKNIAENYYGVTLSAYLKTKLRMVIDAEPEVVKNVKKID